MPYAPNPTLTYTSPGSPGLQAASSGAEGWGVRAQAESRGAEGQRVEGLLLGQQGVLAMIADLLLHDRCQMRAVNCFHSASPELILWPASTPTGST